MDICDNADRIIQQHLEAAIDAAYNDTSVSPIYRDGVALCIDCEEPIPPARLKALPGCCRCVDCQEDYEGDNGAH